MDWADKCALYHCSFVVQMLRLWTVASSHAAAQGYTVLYKNLL